MHSLNRTFAALLAIALLAGCKSNPKTADERDDFREDIRKMEKTTLDRLYAAQPAAKDAVKNAAGYAVFSNFGMKIGIAGGGSGSGVAVDNRTNQPVFMRMAEIQAGLGLGIKQFRLVWVFESKEKLNQFINSGWELGAQSTAAAQAGGQGASFAGAIAVAPGVWLYQLTDNGLALELTAKGTKYYKDDKLN